MEKNELMKPRYEVIADYPNDSLPIGSIINTRIGNCGKQCFSSPITYNEEIFVCPDDYPHLFKKLSWWQHRKVEEMPEYVFSADKKTVFKVDKSQSWSTHFKVENGAILLWDGRTPATLSDYEAYLKTK